MRKSVNLAKFDNSSFFRVGAGFFKRGSWFVCNGLFFKTPFHFYGVKVFLLRLFGAQIGSNVVIKPHVNIKFPWRLTIGDNVWIGEQVWIDNLDIVNIGNNVCISQGSVLFAHNFFFFFNCIHFLPIFRVYWKRIKCTFSFTSTT